MRTVTAKELDSIVEGCSDNVEKRKLFIEYIVGDLDSSEYCFDGNIVSMVWERFEEKFGPSYPFVRDSLAETGAKWVALDFDFKDDGISTDIEITAVPDHTRKAKIMYKEVTGSDALPKYESWAPLKLTEAPSPSEEELREEAKQLALKIINFDGQFVMKLVLDEENFEDWRDKFITENYMRHRRDSDFFWLELETMYTEGGKLVALFNAETTKNSTVPSFKFAIKEK